MCASSRDESVTASTTTTTAGGDSVPTSAPIDYAAKVAELLALPDDGFMRGQCVTCWSRGTDTRATVCHVWVNPRGEERYVWQCGAHAPDDFAELTDIGIRVVAVVDVAAIDAQVEAEADAALVELRQKTAHIKVPTNHRPPALTDWEQTIVTRVRAALDGADPATYEAIGRQRVAALCESGGWDTIDLDVIAGAVGVDVCSLVLPVEADQ